MTAAYPACGSCSRPVRPPHTSAAQHPGTKMPGGKIAGVVHCSTCYQRAWRAGTLAGPAAPGPAVPLTKDEAAVVALVGVMAPSDEWAGLLDMLGLSGKVRP